MPCPSLTKENEFTVPDGLTKAVFLDRHLLRKYLKSPQPPFSKGGRGGILSYHSPIMDATQMARLKIPKSRRRRKR
jgi:hypothetical protein